MREYVTREHDKWRWLSGLSELKPETNSVRTQVKGELAENKIDIELYRSQAK